MGTNSILYFRVQGIEKAFREVVVRDPDGNLVGLMEVNL